MNHKWNKDDECVKCGILREMTTVRVLMAIHNGKDVYKYISKYRYIEQGVVTIIRPNCDRTTYDD